MCGKSEQRDDSGSSGHGGTPPVPPAGDEGADHDGDRDRESWLQVEKAGPKAPDAYCQPVEERVDRPE